MNKNDAINTSLNQIDSDFIKALSEPVRIEILKLIIIKGESDVQQIAQNMPQDRSVISRHLVTMQKAGILKSRKEGRHVIYTVDAKTSIEKSEQIVATIKECVKLGCC